MANVQDVAKFFICAVNNSEDDHITNLKLNKLLFYAQGCHLQRTGVPLFADQIEAWEFGPVVPTVYRTYKPFGKNPLYTTDPASDAFSQDEINTMIDVMREFGQYTGSVLVSKTHAPGTPWSLCYQGSTALIPRASIASYFSSHPVPTFTPSGDIVTAFPADWYDSNEDEEWESYQ